MERWLKIITILLLIINLAGLYYFGEEIGRYLRTGSMLVFLLLYIFRFYSGKHLLSIFVLFTLCDIFLVFYEQISFKVLTYISRIAAYSLIVIYLYPFLYKLKLSIFTATITIFVLAINIYLMSVMVQSVPETMQSYWFQPIFYLFGISLLFLAGFSISFQNVFASKQSFFLVLASFGLIFSDISFYIAHYLNFESFYYADRVANIIGISFLLTFISFGRPDKAASEIN